MFEEDDLQLLWRHRYKTIVALRDANKRLQRQLRQARASKEELVDAVRQAAYDAAVTVGNPPKVPKPRKARLAPLIELA